MTSEDIAKVTDWQSLVRVAHGMAVEKGWWDDGIANRPSEDIVNNFHAEVSEAWEEYRCGRMATWYAADAASVLRSGGVPKPEGFWVEIADLMIRIADYVGSRRFRVPGGYFLGTEKDLESIPAVVSGLHHAIGACGFLTAVDTCEHFAAVHKVDLYATIREKLAYNATRPYRHGGKRA